MPKKSGQEGEYYEKQKMWIITCRIDGSYSGSRLWRKDNAIF